MLLLKRVCLLHIVESLVEVFGDKNKIMMMILLYSKGSLKKTDLYAGVKKSSFNARKLNDLEKVKLIKMTTDRFQNNITMVELTPSGSEVAKRLVQICDVIINNNIEIINSRPDSIIHFTKEGLINDDEEILRGVERQIETIRGIEITLERQSEILREMKTKIKTERERE